MVWINEFHYDNAGADIGEFIEIAGVAGTDMTNWTLVLYNGFIGASYNTIDLSGMTIDDEGSGFGAFQVSAFGIQNGSPDGIALVNNLGAVVEFISYEGSFVAVDGPAAGLVSTDIGVSESSITPIGQSVQLTGTGEEAADFTWSGPAAGSPGDLNAGQTMLCFAAGTLIATGAGEATVETLKISDRVLTDAGNMAAIKWIGRQTVSTRFGPAERLMPVRFAAGSLGEGILHTDLTVTADHGMLVDGVICHAGALVNSTSITQVPLAEMGETYTVYHIETEEHEIILANSAPAETFIDNVSRRVFDNYAEFEALYGDVPEMEELDYPRAMSARQVSESIRAKLSNLTAA